MLLSFPALHSQTFFKIAGGNVKVKGNPHLVLKDASWVNNGAFSGDSATVHFTGTQEDSIDGSTSTTFWNLEVNKTSGGGLKMKNDIGVDSAILMNGGLVNLNGNDMTLGTDNGVIVNESDANRILGPNGGEIIKVIVLNTPSNVNPGNMGAEISSSSNLGSTTIKRGHIPQNLPDGFSIERYYEIVPTNNSGLGATMILSYFDSELNGLTESALESWSDDGTTWINLSPDMTDDVANYVEVTMDELGKITLGEGAIKFAGKVLLQGNYSSSAGMMHDSLRTHNLIPLSEPFTGLGYTMVGSGGETISPDVLTISGSNAIVDWMLLILRDKNDSSIVLRTQPALLQRDGDIVGLDGTSSVTFAGMAEDDYFLSIKHRNHLGVRMPGVTTIARIETSHDFTTGLSQVFNDPNISNAPMASVGSGVYALYRGDGNGDGALNVADFLNSRTNTTPIQADVYSTFDTNLDGDLNVADFLLGRISTTPIKAAHDDN